MVLVDTSVWIDHFNKPDRPLIALLEENVVCTHPFIISELACGNLKNREGILGLLNNLTTVTIAGTDEILFFIDKHKLYKKGLGYVDVHLIASCLIDNVTLYTRDKPIHRAAGWWNFLYIHK